MRTGMRLRGPENQSAPQGTGLANISSKAERLSRQLEVGGISVT